MIDDVTGLFNSQFFSYYPVILCLISRYLVLQCCPTQCCDTQCRGCSFQCRDTVTTLDTLRAGRDIIKIKKFSRNI